MSSICIIGARKGSKRLAGKNCLELNGKPLYQYAIEAALESKVFGKVIFSTDNKDILNSIKIDSELIVDERPEEFSGDNSSMYDVAFYLMDKYINIFDDFDNICFITPCNPFRTSNHIKEASSVFNSGECTSLVSVSKYPCPSEFAMEMDNGFLNKNWTGLVRKGDLPPSYYPNGAISFVKKETFIEKKTVYSDCLKGYLMSWPYDLDIDYKSDFEMAEKLIKII